MPWPPGSKPYRQAGRGTRRKHARDLDAVTSARRGPLTSESLPYAGLDVANRRHGNSSPVHRSHPYPQRTEPNLVLQSTTLHPCQDQLPSSAQRRRTIASMFRADVAERLAEAGLPGHGV